MSDSSTTLRLRQSNLATRLEAPGASHERDQLKKDLASLYRSVDRELAELAALKEEVLGLIERWKSLPMQGAVAASRTTVVPREGGAREGGAREGGAREGTPGGGVRTAWSAPAGAAAGGGTPTPAAVRPAVQADHLGASTFIEKGWHQISVGDAVGAERSLERALQLAPEDPQAEALLGWAQMLQQRHDDALLLFQKVLQSDPNNALARVNMGYICLKKGIFGEAIEHLSRVVRLDNDRKATLYAHFYLGLVYLERDMYEDAEAFFRKTLALGPNLIEAYYELGRALWFGGDQDAARRTWREGFAANKFSPWGKRCAELLETVETGGAPLRSG